MDINEMINNEVPNAMEIQVAIEERNKINKWKKELEEERKKLDVQIKQWMDESELSEVSSDNIKVTIVNSKGSGRWDKQALSEMLSPMQIEEAFSHGKPYSYVKIVEEE